jgi:hypothetical protein
MRKIKKRVMVGRNLFLLWVISGELNKINININSKALPIKNKACGKTAKPLSKMVGTRGFEPPTPFQK